MIVDDGALVSKELPPDIKKVQGNRRGGAFCMQTV